MYGCVWQPQINEYDDDDDDDDDDNNNDVNKFLMMLLCIVFNSVYFLRIKNLEKI